MIPRQTITARHVVTTTDRMGNSTTTETVTEVERCLFEPAQATERTDPRSPGVTTPAKFYAPVALQLDADDEITDADGVKWAVLGGSSVWGTRTEIPVQRTSEV